jgi:hypothetical protein
MQALRRPDFHIRAPEDRVAHVLGTVSEFDRWFPDVTKVDNALQWTLPARIGRTVSGSISAQFHNGVRSIELMHRESVVVRHVFSVTAAGRLDTFVRGGCHIAKRWAWLLDGDAIRSTHERMMHRLSKRAEWLAHAPDTLYVAPRDFLGVHTLVKHRGA